MLLLPLERGVAALFGALGRLVGAGRALLERVSPAADRAPDGCSPMHEASPRLGGFESGAWVERRISGTARCGRWFGGVGLASVPHRGRSSRVGVLLPLLSVLGGDVPSVLSLHLARPESYSVVRV